MIEQIFFLNPIYFTFFGALEFSGKVLRLIDKGEIPDIIPPRPFPDAAEGHLTKRKACLFLDFPTDRIIDILFPFDMAAWKIQSRPVFLNPFLDKDISFPILNPTDIAEKKQPVTSATTETG